MKYALLPLLTVGLFACKDASKTDAAAKPVPAKEASKGADKTAAKVVTPEKTHPDCVGRYATGGPKEAIQHAGQHFVASGARLDDRRKDADQEARFGVLADIKEYTKDNVKNLEQIAEFFRTKKVEGIIAAGDLGETQVQIEQVLRSLATSNLPVYAVIGNREPVKAFNDAIAAVKKTHPLVFNLNTLRLVALDDVALVSVPGYFNPTYLHAEDKGCLYTARDLQETRHIASQAGERPVVLISHGPPKQEGAEALDRTLEQANVGNPELTKLIRDTGIQFGIFANIHEAGGRATDVGGTQLVAPNTWSETLFLNPGPADAVRWKMNDGTESAGMAAVLTVKGQTAKFETFRIQPLDG